MVEQQNPQMFDPADIILYVLSFFVPPLPVLIRVGFWTNQLLLNVLLTMLFGLPGTIHAIYIVYVTSPITGSQERRINGDYERLVENEEPSAPGLANNASGEVGTSQNSYPDGAPPAYEDVPKNFHSPAMDNKIQV